MTGSAAAALAGYKPVDKCVEKMGSTRGVLVDTDGESPPGLRIPAMTGRLASRLVAHCLWIAGCAG
jgi:hypothetical protein